MCRRAVLAVGVALVVAALPTPASAVTVCTAEDIVAADASCPPAGPCTIGATFDVSDGCELDFGTRDVTLVGRLNIDSGTVMIKAGSFEIAPSGFIDGRGTSNNPPNDVGGVLDIDVLGDVRLLSEGSNNARINLSGKGGGGSLGITTLGQVTIAGKIIADSTTGEADGGFVVVRAGGDVRMEGAGEITAVGGAKASGGFVDLDAGGRVQVDTLIDVAGGEGGSLDITAEEDVVLADTNADGGGDGGSGGAIFIIAATGVELTGEVRCKGSPGADFGGSGGFVLAEAFYGDLRVTGILDAQGAGPDGVGGDVSLGARGSVLVEAGAVLSARANGSQSSGGTITVDANLDVHLLAPVDVSGGFAGGSLEVSSGLATTIGAVSAEARTDGGFGGAVIGTAALNGGGALTVSGLIDVDAQGCFQGFCSVGGEIELSGCDVTLPAGAELSANGTAGGRITLLAYEQITVSAPMHSVAASQEPLDAGLNRFIYRSGKPPVVNVAPQPPAVETPAATCTMAGQAGCLEPCPVCGNGLVEFPETCDDLGTPASCDGCSRFCRLEECTDASACTTDSCTPALGCEFVPVPDGSACPSGSCQAGICVPTPTTTTTSQPATTTVPTTTTTTITTPATTSTTTAPTTTTTNTTTAPTTTTIGATTTTTTTIAPPTTTTTTVTATTTTTAAVTTSSTTVAQPTTTTVTATTVTTSTAPTTTPATTSSTTTLPPGCDTFPGVTGVQCRLDRFEDMVLDAQLTAKVGKGVGTRLARIRKRLDTAGRGGKSARRALKQARKEINQLVRYLRQNRKRLDPTVAGALEAAIKEAGQQLAPLLAAGK